MLALNQIIDTKKLAEITAGGRDFIRTKDGKVLGVAIHLNLNPEAPNIVLVGRGEQRQHRARLYVTQATAVPAFVKRASNQWEYIGNYRALKYSESKDVIKQFDAGNRTPDTVAGVLFLEPAIAEESISVFGEGFPDAKTRKEIEEKAISYVWSMLEARGYAVEDKQADNLGYDLLATHPTHQLFVEVKGTDAHEPRFYLTRNEWAVGQREPDWRLFVVTSARSEYRIFEYSSVEVEEYFTLDPLCWACVAK